MVSKTQQDKAWLSVIRHFRYVVPTSASEIADDVGVPVDAASHVLQVAEEEGLVRRDGEQAQIYRPDIGPVGAVPTDDLESRISIQTIVREAHGFYEDEDDEGDSDD